MRVAFFGLPLAALLLRADGHEVALACLCRDPAIGTRRLKKALGAAHVLVRPDANDAALSARVKDLAPDLIVSWFWTTRLPMRIVRAGRLGAFGVHPSLLPRHRGPDPYFWALDAGDRETGVTAHRIADAYDTGAILGEPRRLAIDPSWNSWTLAKKMDRPSLALLRETVRAFERGAPPDEHVQDESLATEAPVPDDDALEIDWHLPTERIERRVRAASPWPGAFTYLGDEPIAITRVRPASAFPKVLEPGEAAVMETPDGPRAVIRTADGALELIEGRGEGDPPYDLDAESLADLVATLRELAIPGG